MPNNSVHFVIATLNRGGAEHQLVQVASGLKNRGWRVSVTSLLSSTPLAAPLELSGIPVNHLGMRRGIADPRAIFRLAATLRRLGPDLVHSHMVHANLLARATRLICPMTALICTVQNIDEEGRGRELAYRLTDRLADVTTIICRAAGDRYVRIGAVPREKLRVLPNGVDVVLFSPDTALRNATRRALELGGNFVWLAIGRLDVQKDYGAMLRAFALLNHPGSVLLIAGEGPLRPPIESLARELNIAPRVRFLGFRADTPALMNAADAYLMSSAWEGLPMALLEAAACALPAVATNVGGNAEVVRDGASGFLAPPQDADALAASMRCMLNLDDNTRRKMGSAARAHVVARFSLDAIVDQWEALYRAVLAGHPVPPAEPLELLQPVGK